MNAADFFADLDFFARLGRIGSAPLSLWAETLRPEIGTQAHIICHCGENVRATLDGRSFGDRGGLVADGHVLVFGVAQDRPYIVHLEDDDGQTCEIVLQPAVDIPEMTRLTLPARPDYAEGVIHCALATEKTHDITAKYRAPGRDWRSLPMRGEAFDLPVETRAPHRIDLCITVASRHARFTERARRTYEAQVDIQHPLPICRLDAVAQPIHRFDARELELRFLYHDGVVVCHAGARHAFGPGHAVHRLVLDTATVGEQPVMVELRGRDGALRHEVFFIPVLPRPHTVSVTRLEDGCHVAIGGAVAATLTVPARHYQHSFPSEGGRIRHALRLPATAHIDAIDDQGGAHRTTLTLSPPRPVAHPLPPMRKIAFRLAQTAGNMKNV